MKEPKGETAGMIFRQPNQDTLLVALSGVWKIGRDLPSADEVRMRLEPTSVRKIAFETGELADWDSILIDVPD